MPFPRYDNVDAANDSESENEYRDSVAPRTSEDVRKHDHETLTAEEEAERLLGRQDPGRSRIGKLFNRDGDAQAARTTRRKRRSKGDLDEKKELMYEMEEGGPRLSSAESSASSSEADLHKLGEIQARRKVGTWIHRRLLWLHAGLTMDTEDPWQTSLRYCIDQCFDYCRIRCASLRRLQSLHIEFKRSEYKSKNTLQWHTHLRANNGSLVLRRLPRGLPYPWDHSDSE